MVTVVSLFPVSPPFDPENTLPSPSDRRPFLELTVVRGVLLVSRTGELLVVDVKCGNGADALFVGSPEPS